MGETGEKEQGSEAEKKDVVVDIVSPSMPLTLTQHEPTLCPEEPMQKPPAESQAFDQVTEPAASPAALPAQVESLQDAQPRGVDRADTKSWDESLDQELELVTEVTYKGFPESVDRTVLTESTFEPFKSVADAMPLQLCLEPLLGDVECPLSSLTTHACRWVKQMDETPGDGDALPLDIQKAIRLYREMYSSCTSMKERAEKDSSKLLAAKNVANSGLDRLKSMREAGKISAEALHERRLALQKWLRNTEEALKSEGDACSKAHDIICSNFEKALEVLVTTAKFQYEADRQKAELFSETEFFAELDQVMTTELEKSVSDPEKTAAHKEAHEKKKTIIAEV